MFQSVVYMSHGIQLKFKASETSTPYNPTFLLVTSPSSYPCITTKDITQCVSWFLVVSIVRLTSNPSSEQNTIEPLSSCMANVSMTLYVWEI